MSQPGQRQFSWRALRQLSRQIGLLHAAHVSSEDNVNRFSGTGNEEYSTVIPRGVCVGLAKRRCDMPARNGSWKRHSTPNSEPSELPMAGPLPPAIPIIRLTLD